MLLPICSSSASSLGHAPTVAKYYGQLCVQLLGEQENIIPLSVSTSASEADFITLLWAVMCPGAVASATTPLAASIHVQNTPAFRDGLYSAFTSAMRACKFPKQTHHRCTCRRACCTEWPEPRGHVSITDRSNHQRMHSRSRATRSASRDITQGLM